MHPKPNQKLFLLIQATILSIFCEGVHINISSALNPNCNDEGEFNCGNIQYITRPFWGGSYPRECGRQGFELVCQAGVPMLNISSLSYRVRELNFLDYTLKVAREDLCNNTCPKVLHNTTIDFNLFKYPYISKDENVTLYFDCTVDQPQVEKPASKFTCAVKSAETFNFFRTGDGSSGPGRHITCSSNIFVPINKEAAQYLENPSAPSINILRSALESGFSIQWLQDSHSLPFCNASVYGSCIGGDGSVSKRPCSPQNVCGRPADTPVPSVAPEERQGPPIVESSRFSPKGMPPVQSHGNPPESPSYYPQTEYGMPPLRSPGNNFQTGNGLNARKNPAKEIVIVAPLSIIGAIIVSITIRCFLKKRHSASGPNPVCKQNLENFLVQHGSLTPKRYKYSEIKKITKSFGDKLGQGGYGSVYKGMLPDGCLVAVKVLIETDSNGEEFINEVASISRTSHVNIVSLLGFCYEGKKRALVYEFMLNKSLDKFLNNNGSRGDENCCLSLENLYKIVVGIAKGLEYLHTGCSTRIVHFDIKPQNILLDEDFCPKISDFGLAKLCKKKQSILSVLGTRGTIGYIAPEVFSRNFGGVSHKSDVYSYGMMVLEMAGAKEIVKADVMQSSENYFPDKIYEQVIIDVTKKLDDFMIGDEEETRRKMFLIGFWCIQTSPSDRPSMSRVVEMLEGSLQSIQIPPKPFLFSPNLPGQKISSSFSEYIEIENSVED